MSIHPSDAVCYLLKKFARPNSLNDENKILFFNVLYSNDCFSRCIASYSVSNLLRECFRVSDFSELVEDVMRDVTSRNEKVEPLVPFWASSSNEWSAYSVPQTSKKI